MNELGSVLLVLSGATVLFSICMAFLGLDLRSERNLIRIFSLDILDALQKNKGPRCLSRRWSRQVFSWLHPFKLFCLQALRLPSTDLARRLSGGAVYINFAIVSLSLLTLIILMLQGDLSNRYVVSHTSQDLPAYYRITGVWAGSSGSLLFWYWLLCLFCAITVYQSCKPSFKPPSSLFLILGFVQLLFVFLNLFFRDAQPFRTYPLVMQAGRGINPLLLHWGMIVHPPLLYIGYVSSVIPFSLLMSALISGNIRNISFSVLRRWSIFSWLFLGTGILLGSKWAYEELGWGGYWAWDPVENASLMPWLIFTAFLHSFIVQERLGMLRFWNVILITLTYHMCLLGTWITRSGILEGPHTFAESSIGTPMIIYISISFVYFLRFLYFSRHSLRPQRAIQAVTSKEGSLLLNNFVMLLAMCIILIGVFSPLLPLECSFESGSFQCYKVEWKQDTYNRLLIPLGIFTLFLMGASPLFPWRRSGFNWRYVKKNLLFPLIVGGVVAIIFSFSYGLLFTLPDGPDVGIWGSGLGGEIMAIITIATAGFVIAGISQEYWRGISSRYLRFGESRWIAFVRLFSANNRRYGGYLVHLSIVLLLIGYAGSAFKKTKKLEFHYYKQPSLPKSDVVRYYSGDIAYIESYQIQARDFFFRPVIGPGADPQNPIYFTISQEAHYHVQKGQNHLFPPRAAINSDAYAYVNYPRSSFSKLAKFLVGYNTDGHMRTERHFYPQIDPISGQVLRDSRKHTRRIPTSEPDIRSSWNEDIYIQLGAVSASASQNNFPLNHLYESYYHLFKRDDLAYRELFPSALRISLEVWINPMVKCIWLGSLLFFLSGLILFLGSVGERK